MGPRASQDLRSPSLIMAPGDTKTIRPFALKGHGPIAHSASPHGPLARSPFGLRVLLLIILAFWLVLAYDLFEDRCTIDVIIAKFLLLCFKMAEFFENLASILHDWAKEKCKKSIRRGRGDTPEVH